MAVSFVLRRFFAVLDGFLRAPLKAGKTLLAAHAPNRFSVLKNDIVDGAHLAANSAMAAIIIDPEFPIHFRDL